MDERDERPPSEGFVIPPRPPLPPRPPAPEILPDTPQESVADDVTAPIERVEADAASPAPADGAPAAGPVGAALPDSEPERPAWAGHEATARQPVVAGPEAPDTPAADPDVTAVLEPLLPAAAAPAESSEPHAPHDAPATTIIDSAEPQPAPAEPEATTLELPVIGAGGAAAHPVAPQQTPEKPRRTKHRGRAALIWSIAIILVLGIGGVIGWFVGEAWAEKAVTAQVQEKTAKALGISDPSTIDVTLTDPVLPQVIGGSLTTLDVTAPNTPIGGATGTVTLHAADVPTRGGGEPSSATASVSMSPEAITTLAGSLGDTVPGSLKVEGSNLTVTLNPAQFLSRVTVVVTFTPTVANGQLVLTPSAFQVGKFDMSAETIRQRFGGLADGMLAPRTVCVASAFPKGLTLTGIQLSPAAVVADFSVDPALATDPALQAKGTCG